MNTEKLLEDKIKLLEKIVSLQENKIQTLETEISKLRFQTLPQIPSPSIPRSSPWITYGPTTTTGLINIQSKFY